jgi:thymidylate synthase
MCSTVYTVKNLTTKEPITLLVLTTKGGIGLQQITFFNMNKLDKDYTDLLQDILDNGVTKQDRTGTGTISVFARQIRHNMKDGFPLLTTKKMPFKTIVTELIWFLRGDTNIKFLVDNNCHIWNGDCYWNYLRHIRKESIQPLLDLGWCVEPNYPTQEEFINKIKTDDEFAKKWGELGPIYGAQWRGRLKGYGFNEITGAPLGYGIDPKLDQIQNLINDLKTNPDSRRLMVNAWAVHDLPNMVLPPCHYGFQVYTRELSLEEREKLVGNKTLFALGSAEDSYDEANIPRRAISLMWNQRSVDTFLGLPFNIASYGLLLEIIAKAVNMVPDQLIGNLGDVHLYSNHIEQAKEQIGREMDLDERKEYSKNPEFFQDINGATWSSVMGLEALTDDHKKEIHNVFNEENIPKRTRQPFPLPKLNINTEWWPTIGGECGVGPLDANAVFEGFKDDNFCRCLLEEDIQLYDYNSHPAIKAPLSN